MKNLRAIRKQHNISMKKLGEAINLGESTISQYESGNREPSFDILIKIADYFNVSIDYLLGRSESSAVSIQQSAAQPNYDDETATVLEILDKLPYGGKVLVRRYAELTYRDFAQIHEKRDSSIKKLS